MQVNIEKVPFSRYGSYFAISQDKSGRYTLRDVHGGDDAPSDLFELSFHKEGRAVEVEVVCTETLLKFVSQEDDKDQVEMILPTERHLMVKTQGISLSLKATKVKYDTFHELGENTYEYHIYPKELKIKFTRRSGDLSIDAPWNIIGNDHVHLKLSDGELLLESYQVVFGEELKLTFEEGKEKVKLEYETFRNTKGECESRYKQSMDLASYITWSSVVHPEGNLAYPAMFMSKLWMYNIWSWDNCFNALALAENHPQLAYRQLGIFMDHQDASGAYPDFINDRFKSYNCIKPPIFPYFYLKYMEKNPFFKERENLEKAYESMAKNLDYYEKYRTYEGRIPHYRHGNDSGWDNASLFHAGMPAESPDLSAHLIRSYDAMKVMAEVLGKVKDIEIYKDKADVLQKLLLEKYYDEEGFFGRYGREGKKNPVRTSLILSLPLIIGYRLDKQVVEGMVKGLEAFEADYGLATESLKSDKYKVNGYWLGPIWAPVSYLFIDSLFDLGYTDLAERLRRKYLELTLVGGMAENFDPYTGEGLVDTSFTWTSSVFLELLKRKEGI